MAKHLTAKFVHAVRHSGRTSRPEKHYDQHGLFLQVKPTGSKQWIQRLVVDGKRHDYGLGGYPVFALSEAREAAWLNRRAARRGEVPPCEANRKRGVSVAVVAQAHGPTFAAAYESVLAIRAPAWKATVREHSTRKWRQGLRDYLGGIADTPVGLVTAADIRRTVDSVWTTKHKTAQWLLQRISLVMRYAIAEGHRTEDPVPAVTAAMPAVQAAPVHFRALPHAEVGAALAQVRASDAPSDVRLAFELLVLTALRSGEARLAQWEEIDLDARLWTIPGARMKSGAEHRVPLSPRAVEILRKVRRTGDGTGLVFRAARGGALPEDAFRELARRASLAATPHGFRSSFRSWCGDTAVAREVAEAALAHAVGNRVEAAYHRTDLLARRREVMDQWAAYVAGEGVDGSDSVTILSTSRSREAAPQRTGRQGNGNGRVRSVRGGGHIGQGGDVAGHRADVPRLRRRRAGDA